MKCAKIMVIIVIFVFAVSVSCAADTNNASISEDNSQMLLSLKNEITDDTSENSILAQTNNDETLSAQKNSEILRANEEGNYSDLRNDINNGGNLKKSYYHYQQGDGDTIVINRNGFTVNGNGAVIDMKGSNIQAFVVTGSGVTFKNLTIKNANFDGSGGAIYFSKSGTVENCNFTGNTATSAGGAVYFWNQGNVTNCNFTDNEATGTYSYGGAVYFEDGGTVLNCNFTGNTATTYGGAIRMYSGTVSNCNFTGNNATRGGAVYFLNKGNVTNCNFTGNTATTGSAIFFYHTSEQKSVSNSIFLNNRANANDLQVIKNENNITIIFTGNNNLLNAIYSNGDVSFSNVTYWGANGIVNTNSYTPSRTNKESGQNITVEIYGSDDNLVENVTLVTDDKGQVTYDFIKLRNGEYKYKAYHIEDCYYTYAEYKDTFTLISDLGDFNRLQKYIDGASENSILTLCRDYTFTIGSDENLVNGIVIDKPLTINGNGYAINALQKARIFNVNAGNVVLNNIAFTNATASGDGGAIYFSSSGTVENCNFTGNNATGMGGAVYFNRDGNVANCNFVGNKATDDGGAVYFRGSCTVENCNFTGNNATGNGGGGAVYWSGARGVLSGSNFTGNNANGRYGSGGGAVYWNGADGSLSGCNFTGNTATSNSDGGAVYWYGVRGVLSGCSFVNCSSNAGGGAVYWSGSQGVLSGSSFTGNTAKGEGGAIRMFSGTVSNCNFTGNTAKGDGGAIRMFTGTVSNCNFTGNTATTGSAIDFYSTSEQKSVSNSIFLNNRANAEYLQVIKNENIITIIFTGNNNLLNAICSDGDVSFSNVTYWGANGIVNTNSYTPSRTNKESGQNITVEIYGSDDNLVENVTLVTDDKGQVTYDFIKLRNGEYKYKAYHIEDCYYTYAEYKGTFTLNSNLGDFNRLQKYINGASENSILTLCRDYTFTIGSDENLVNGIVIDKPLTINGNGYKINALQKARIFNVNAGNVVLNNIAFTNATASGSGGAIYFSQSGTVENCNFTDNQASGGDGGAIRMSSGTVSNCNFTGNTATHGGGAVYFLNQGTVENCNFTDNQASGGDGGAIRMSSGTVSNCNFTGNTATHGGGAVYFLNQGTVENCNFTDNQASGGDGGAIRMSSGTVSNCNFSGNTATRNGGAVYISGTGTVSNCNFTGNNATDWGGAIYMGSGTVSNCNFTGNNATGSGGAIRMFSGTVSNCNFTGNNATFNGGAIWMSSGTVSNCNFTGNNATGSGGAIWMSSGTVSNCNFSANTATEGGAVYISGTGTVSNCNFTGNTATTGSAIYFYSTSAQKSVSNSIFLNNRANAKDLQVTKNENNITIIFTGNNNILNAIYSNGDVSFSNVTYWGESGIVNTDTYKPSISNNAAGQNITVSIVINDKIDSNEVYVTDENGTIVLNRNVGDNYFIGVCHDTDSYYTEILNSTSKNTQFSVSVNNQTTNNRKVNITAKSNIPNEVLKGKLLFILPNSTQINANYTANGTWWAVHEFDDAGDYVINASYMGLDGVIINNATISIRYDASVDVNNRTLDLFVEDTFTIDATTTPKGLNVTYVPDDSGVYSVDENGVVTALKNGTGSVLVKIGGDGVYAENSTIVTVTVTKVPTEIKVTNTTLNLEVNDEIPTGATLSPDDAGNLTYNLSNEGIVKIEDGKIIALKEGNVTITVSFKGNNKYLTAENKTINVTVTLKNARVSVNNNTLDLFVDDTFTIVANTTPKGLKVTYKPDNSGIISVDENGVITALKEGNTTIIVSVGDNKVYAENTTTVTVTVRKIPTEILITNETLDLKVNDKVDSGAGLNPSEAGNLTYTISETSIIKLLDNQIIALSEGSATISYSFAGNDKYAAAQNKTITVKVSLNDASVRVNNNTLNLLIDDTFTIVATTVPRGLNVTYMPDNSGIISIDENGIVTALKEGTAPIIVKVGGDGVYAENTTTVTVTVNKISTDISIANATVNLNVDDEVSTGAKLNPEEAGNLTYTSSDENIAIVKDGKIIALKEGDAIITVSFKGNNKYGEAKNKTIKVTVKKVNPTMDASAEDITEGENATINVELPIDATGNVTTAVNGKNYSSPVDNGKAIITISGLEYGNYILPVTYSGDDKYNPLTKDVNLTVKEDKIIVSAPDLTKYYSGHESFNVNVFYANGRAIAGKEVKITINGVTYSRTTDENGSALLNINLNSATYDTVVEVDNITVNSLVTILPTIEAEDVESKSKNIVFSATFIDGEGNYLKDGTNVSFNVGGIIYNSQVIGDKGRASVDLVLNHGRYIITSQNTVTGEYISNSIAIDLKDADMTLSGDKISVGEKATISVTLPDDATGNVTATINGKTYTNKVNNGKTNIIIPDLSAGNYTAHVTYSGDNNYNHATGNVSISVSKVDAIIDIEDSVITVGENATVIVILPSDATGDVKIGNEIVPLKEGSASAILTDLPVGITTIPVTYFGDDKYNPVESSADVVVNDKPAPEKANLTIKATAYEITEGEDAVIIVTGLENATGNVSAVVHGHVHSAPIVDGTANITIKGLVENATAFVSYAGDDLYNSAVTSVNITVNKNTVNINAGNLTKYYKDPQKFTVTVTDAKGQPATNKTVEITINGVTYTRTTDENGTASLNINLNSGEYPVSVAVDDVMVNSTVFVKATIDASDVVKVFRNDTQYYATFVDVNGTPTANTVVSFNVNGVIYNRTTDGNGTAKLNINLPSGEYILTATNTVTGEKISNVIKVLSVIESSDLTKYFRSASQFIVRIHTADGGYVGAGEEVRFNINGMIYAKKTNATGHAKININLPPGNYTVTTYYKDFSQGNSIEVLPILSAEDLSMKYMDGSQFKAQLVDGQGKPYPKQDVTFNINGVFYNRPTDSDGVAKLNIRLLAGQYIITSTYNGCNIANKVTIKS